jgi:hypothetical protein
MKLRSLIAALAVAVVPTLAHAEQPFLGPVRFDDELDDFCKWDQPKAISKNVVLWRGDCATTSRTETNQIEVYVTNNVSGITLPIGEDDAVSMMKVKRDSVLGVNGVKDEDGDTQYILSYEELIQKVNDTVGLGLFTRKTYIQAYKNGKRFFMINVGAMWYTDNSQVSVRCYTAVKEGSKPDKGTVLRSKFCERIVTSAQPSETSE